MTLKWCTLSQRQWGTQWSYYSKCRVKVGWCGSVPLFFQSPPQSQLSACSKALESSEELLELANQTLCSSETDGFTQVTHRHGCWRPAAAACPSACSFIIYEMTDGGFDRPYTQVDLSSSLCHAASCYNKKPTSDFFCVCSVTTWWAPTQFSLSLRISSFPSLLLLSRRPKTLRIGIVLSHPLLPFCHRFL